MFYGIIIRMHFAPFGVFQRIKDKKIFDRVRVSFDTVR